MRKCKRRVQCPHCHGLNTKHRGKRQLSDGRKRNHWYCHDCQREFTPYLRQFSKRATHFYYDNGETYRTVSKEIGLSLPTTYYKIKELSLRCKDPHEVSAELKPSNWSGYILLDSDALFVKGIRESLLLSMDASTQDIPASTLARIEDQATWEILLSLLKEKAVYPLKAIVSDGEPSVWAAINKILPTMPHQLCLKHYHSFIYYRIRNQITNAKGKWRSYDKFMSDVYHMLFANSEREIKESLDCIARNYEFRGLGLTGIIKKMYLDFSLLTVHFRHPGLPRTTSSIEGLISRLDAKINMADGYWRHETAWATLKMIILRYRFKKFTDSSFNEHNGKCPLELAGVDTSKIDWIRYSQRDLKTTII
jgi:transposase-like protein